MKKASRTLALALGLAAVGCAHAGPLAGGAAVVYHVMEDIKAGNCTGAVKRLNEALPDNNPRVDFLAASMFDNGTCVKPDWKSAARLYEKAHDGGIHAAAYRLAAGYAAPDGGPDIAAALWWLAHTNPAMWVDGCEVPSAAVADPDRFVAELKSWPAHKLTACNYAAGVVASVSVEVHYPESALVQDRQGQFRLRFSPGLGRIEIQSGKTGSANCWTSAKTASCGPNAKIDAGSFEETLLQVAQRALQRYPKPEGIDPAWQVSILFNFET